MLTIYKASAGSGKTYTLAFEYARMLLGVKTASGAYRLNSPPYLPARLPDRHRGILAITFTNKATDEMKGRIVREIDALAHIPAAGAPDAAYAPALMAETGCTRAELAAAAATALEELLRDYQNFNISTIDSFFQTVLRTFAREVERPGDYEVEVDDTVAVTASLDAMFEDANYTKTRAAEGVLRWIRSLTSMRVEQGRRFNVFDRSDSAFAELVQYVKNVFSEDFKGYGDAVMQYLADPRRIEAFRAAVGRIVASFAAANAAAVAAARDAVTAEGFDFDAVVNSSLLKIINNVAGGGDLSRVQLKSPGKALGACYDSTYTADTLYVKTRLKPYRRTPSAQASASVASVFVTFRDNQLLRDMWRSVAIATYNFEALGHVWRYIEDFRRDNNLILLSDTSEILSRIISEEEMPFIYERLGVSLHHFLIDEFQDTSRMQWANLRPLVATGVADGHDSLIIGDEKQSIYRFRNSDSSLLHHEVGADPAFSAASFVRGVDPADNTNHRSAHGIVRFNNTVFSRIAALTGIDGFENVVQSTFDKLSGLDYYVKITDLSVPDGVDDDGNDIARDPCAVTAAEILRQHAAGYAWRDIAVLTRTRSEGETIINYLKLHHPEIELQSAESLLLANSPAVRVIVGILELMDRCSPSPSSATDGSVPYKTRAQTKMMISRAAYYTGSGFEPSEALERALADSDASTVTDINADLRDLRSLKASTLPALVQAIVVQKVPEPLRMSQLAYIAAFIDVVIDYCSRYTPGIHGFLKYWNSRKDTLAVPASAGSDAVSVMTIHKAKGLEWACVHVPFAASSLRNSRRWVSLDNLADVSGVDAEIVPPALFLELDSNFAVHGSPFAAVYEAERRAALTDEANAFYVALTRPARELCVCYSSVSTHGDDVLIRRFHEAMAAPLTEAEKACGLMVDTAAAFDPSAGVMCLGAPTTPAASESRAAAASLPAPDFRASFRADTAHLTTIDDITTLDIVDDDDEPDGSTRYRIEAAERGTLLHAILGECVTEADLPAAVERVRRRCAGCVPPDFDTYAEVIVAALRGIDDVLPGAWFSPDVQVLTERSIYEPAGDSMYRPDRIVRFADGRVHVVDYKFTSEPRASHRTQVARYKSLLADMGYDDVEGYLWYPEQHMIINV